MVITWTTLLATTTSTVQWGPVSSGVFIDEAATNAFPNSAAGTNRTYTWSGWIGQIHEATMTGLTPDTLYGYRVGDAAGGWSDVYQFRTLPTNAGTAERPLRIVQIGDMGFGPASNVTIDTVTKWVQAGQVDFVAHVGTCLPSQLARAMAAAVVMMLIGMMIRIMVVACGLGLCSWPTAAV